MTSNKKNNNDIPDFASFVVSSHLSKFKELINPPKPKRGLLDFVSEELARINKKQAKKKKA